MQHLNLYSQIDRYVEPPFSARQLLRLSGGALVIMVAIYVMLLLAGGGLKKELNNLAQEQKSVEQQLAQLKARKSELENNPELDQEIALLQRNVDFRKRLLGTIDPEGSGSAKGFAEHLSGLARQHIDGMWFTEIQLHQGGQQMALLGETRVPAYVPQYLQKLATEPVFEGHRFRVLRMHTPEERRNLHSFELRAKDVGEP